MWIIRYIDGIEEVRWLKSNHAYNFGRAEENDFILQSQAASRYQFSLHVGDIGRTQLHECDYVTPLKLEIKSRAKTIVGEKVYRLSKTNKESIMHDLTNNQRIELSVPKTVIQSGSQAKKIEQNIKIILEWKPLCIFAASDPSSSELNKLENDLEALYKDGYDLRITTDPYVATHFCSAKPVPDLDLQVALVRQIPILSQEWIRYLKNQNNNVESWFLKLDPIKFFPPISREAIVPNSKRQCIFDNITFVVLGILDEKLARLLKFVGGSIVKLEVDSYFDDRKLLKQRLSSALDEVKNPIMFKIDESENKKYGNTDLNKDLEVFIKECKSQIITKDDIVKCIIECDIGQLQVLDLIKTKRPPKKKRKYEKLSKIDFLDFSSPVSTQIMDSPKESAILIEDVTDSVVAKSQIMKELDVEDSQVVTETPKVLLSQKEDNDKEITDSIIPKSPFLKESVTDDAGSLNLNVSTTASIDNDEISNRSKMKVDGDFLSPPELGYSAKSNCHVKSEAENQALKRHNDDSLDSDKDLNRVIKSRKINPPLSLANAIKLTKEKAEKSASLDLDEDEIESGLNKDLTDLSIVEVVELKPRNKNLGVAEDGKYTNGKNFKKFMKNSKLKSNITRTFVSMSAVTIKNDYKFVDHDHNSGIYNYLETETRMADDFKDEIGEIRNYQIENKSQPTDSVFTQSINKINDDNLFVSIDSQDDSNDEVENASKFTFNGANSNNTQTKRSSVMANADLNANVDFNANVTNDNDDDDDDDNDDVDDDVQFKFGFSR